MKLDTHEVITACYEAIQRSHPKMPVTAEELVEEVPDLYRVARDATVEMVAKWLFAHFGVRLAEWHEVVADKVAEVDQVYYYNWLSGDLHGSDEDKARGVAAALAVVLFYRSEDRGNILYHFTMSLEEAAAWLDQYAVPIHSNPAQRSLFAMMGAA